MAKNTEPGKEKTDSLKRGNRDWFVRMSNGSVFGPINTTGLQHWVHDGRVMPDDEVSEDRVKWISARELPELEMDTMIELPDGTFMGPFNLKAIDPLAREGKIPPKAIRFHIDELESKMATRQMALFGDEAYGRAALDGGDDDTEIVDDFVRESFDMPQDFEEQIEAIRRQANDAIAELERRVAEAEDANMVLAEKLAAAEATDRQGRADALEAATAELAQLKADNETLATTLADTEAKLEAALAANAELVLASPPENTDALKAEIETLAEKVTAAEFAGAEWQRLAKELEEENARLKEAMAEAVALETEQLKAHIVSLENLAEESARDKAALLDQFEQVKTAFDAKEKAFAAFAQENDALREKLAVAESALESAKAEFAELLEFSNDRDAAFNKQIEELRTAVKDSATRTDNAESQSDSVASATRTDNAEFSEIRREKELELELIAALDERDKLRAALTEANAKNAFAEHVPEGDIALIKKFAEEALVTMGKILKEEKETNMAARALSAERQKTLHSEIERLARVMERDPGEITRAEQFEQRNERRIAELQQELESVRRRHQADMVRADANEKAQDQRYKALAQKEAAARERLSRVEQRTADYDSLNNQLRRRENALLAAEKEFENARQQWQIIEATLQNRIDELENGAGSLFDKNGRPDNQQQRNATSAGFRPTGWMRNMK